ncbi:ribosomal-processing cysteine protease Prp [Paenibacillus montanisoli]|uniref:Ribosomal processing cysteine protease Prp n=1 Tax=Paenibacillus montanisoli TaxID=2081970 RepID=A0A328U7T5_9BACL|nr:ribosomal-processing cysteine protease Prp [Paenibacillus montanisoli]RAP77873.1 ribosomal-processing cysteine protease Prp [Paenibacillus montanisoli]
MITVTIERQSAVDLRIVSFAIEGHAKFAKPGKDIVCAGVSAVSVGTVNAIEELAGLVLPASMKSGWLRSDIPTTADAVSNEKAQLLLEGMIVQLNSIAASYGKFVQLRQQFRE